MTDKVLIKVFITDIDTSYDLFVPINEYVWKVKKLMVKAISDMSQIDLDINGDYYLINKDTTKMYDNNDIIYNTDIRNGSELILFCKKSVN